MSKKYITSVIKENKVLFPPKNFSDNAYIKNIEQYKELYKKSIENPEAFWAKLAEQLHWFKKWDIVLRNDNGFYKWFEGGYLNVAYNCLDRHIKTWRRNKAAIIWESEQGEIKTYTYQQLFSEVCKFANVLKNNGVRKGDRICIYLPMIPELVISMLACARIGAVHNVVFGGFSPQSLKERIKDSEAKLLITSDGGFRKGKVIPLKNYVDAALTNLKIINKMIVVKRTDSKVKMKKGRDFWWHELMKKDYAKPYCDAEHMHSEDSLFILYTSGTTGKPKGILHTTGGYLLYVYQTMKWIFDVKDEDVHFCTADIGWITGHSYIVYGPLANGATSLMFEGTPFFPKPDRFWEIIENHKVTIFYTAPTAIRALEKEGDKWPNLHDLSSLRLLGTVGEPINPKAWLWYYKIIGKEKCPIVDTWWQTETGGILITPLPGATPLKPGSATLPFFGIEPAVLREDGSEANVDESGYLAIKKPWPGMLRTVWGNPEKYKKTYFSKFSGIYLTGDSAKRDSDGYFWVMGRLDDVVNVSGHRLGTAEVESAIVSHNLVAEAAIVPFPHKIKGQALYAFVTLRSGVKKSEALKEKIRQHVAKVIGSIAKPDMTQFADALPKTRSGKIMRRILKAIAQNSRDFGNISTLADPSVVEKLYEQRIK